MLLIKRLILLLLALGVIVAAIAISGLNAENISLNFYWFKCELSLGFAVVLSACLGLLVGLLMALFAFYMPLKSEIRKLNRYNRQLLREKTQNTPQHQQIEHTHD